MSPRSIGPALALTLASVLMASSAEAATAFVRVTDPRSPPSYHDEGAGEAHATLGEYFSVRAEAAAYEYVGGVGVFARGDVGETAANLQGQAFAGAVPTLSRSGLAAWTWGLRSTASLPSTLR